MSDVAPGDSLDLREQTLRELVRSFKRVIIAYSGGVDSALVLAVAVQELGDNALAVTAQSPSVAQGEVEAAAGLARRISAQHVIIRTREFDDERYRRNGGDRCFYCKHELFSRLGAMAKQLQFDYVLDGTNADDGASPLDHRPGRQAARQLGVRSPLADAGLRKDDVRAIARRLDLPVWNKPATPCLASRIPYGTRVDTADLRKVDLSERYLRANGFPVARVRHFGRKARIEVPVAEVARLDAMATRMARVFKGLGYDEIEILKSGYRSGNLNAARESIPFEGRPRMANQ